MNRTIAAAFTSLTITVACGGHSQSEGSAAAGADAGGTIVEGSVGGISLPSAYAIAIPDNSNAGTGPTSAFTTLVVGIANKPLGCNTPALPNSTIVSISIKSPGDQPVGLGSYTINVDSTSSYDNLAALVTTDSTCTEVSPSDCIGGTVTITGMTGTNLSGTFNLAFESGEALYGTFGADICDTIPPSLEGTTC